MAMLWRSRFPLTRLGLLLVVGSLAVSAFRYYIAFAQQVSDLNGKDPALDRRSIWDQVLREFLFSGTLGGLLFWAGVALLLAGIARTVALLFRR